MRLEQLTFTRFLAAISIVIYHFGEKIFPFNLDSTSFLFKQANIGVSYFFILSGFVMIIAYSKKGNINFIDYIRKRFARLYPVYALAILLLFLLKLLIPSSSIDYQGLLLNLTLLQSWIPAKALSFNYPGWSLSVEMFFYITFPFLFNHIYQKISFKKILFGVLTIFIASQLLFHYLLDAPFFEKAPSIPYNFSHYFPLMHINQFLIGNIAGIIFINSNFKNKNYDIAILLLIGIITFLLKEKFDVSYHNGLLALLFIPLIFTISLNTGVLAKISNLKPLVFLGEISYSIYILQVPIFIFGSAIMNKLHFDDKALIFWSNLILLIITSGLSYKYLEIPLRQKINNWK